jgi:multimeric flavodoxin WrbA
MKKIMIIDGGPRKTFNTASMLKKFAEGASSVSDQIEVKTVRLYGLDFKGIRCRTTHGRKYSCRNQIIEDQ